MICLAKLRNNKVNKYIVYKIVIEGVVRYIGRTNNIKGRTYQHKRDLKGRFNGLGTPKKFYDNLILNYRDKGLEWILDQIILIPIKDFKTKILSKRWEMFIILEYYFSDNNTLWQKVPNISDR